MEREMNLGESLASLTFEIAENSDSQNRQILAYLMAGHTIEPHTARRLFGCERLASRIYDLREMGKKMGFKIITYKMEYTKPNGKKTRYAKYALKEVEHDG